MLPKFRLVRIKPQLQKAQAVLCSLHSHNRIIFQVVHFILKWPIALLINASRNHIETSCVGWQAQEHVQLPENARRDASDVKPFSKNMASRKPQPWDLSFTE
jgi:hypothetical protein